MKTHKSSITLLAAASLLFSFHTFGQQPAATETAPIQISGIEVREEALTGSQKKWAKVVCSLNNKGGWGDNVSLNYYVVIGTPGHQKLLVGGLTFVNVPAGRSEAIMYLTPNTVERLGAPSGAMVELYMGDDLVQTTKWHDIPQDPVSKFQPVDKILLNVRQTPWIITDFDKMPDMVTF